MAEAQRIKVVITERQMLSWPHQHALMEFHKVKLLKSAGIPINGVNQLDSVFSGRLTMWREIDLNNEAELHFEWTGPVIKPKAVPVDDDDEL